MLEQQTPEAPDSEATTVQYDPTKDLRYLDNINPDDFDSPEKLREFLEKNFRGPASSAIPYVLEQVLTQKRLTEGSFYPIGGHRWGTRELSATFDDCPWLIAGAIVVQNISMEWIVGLMRQFKVSLDFFRTHIELICVPDVLSADIHIDFRMYRNENEALEMPEAERFDRQLRHGFRVSCCQIRAGLCKYVSAFR